MNENVTEILGKELKCLDKGFVRLIDVMGDDSSIVQAARVSYGKGTKSVRMDRELIRYLLRHKHTSPFEMVEFKFHVKLPIFVARQWIRHRTANVNEYSGRYSEMKDEFYIPDIEQIRTQSSTNRQSRGEDSLPDDISGDIITKMQETQSQLYSSYKAYLEDGLARELARINLPLSAYTEWYWKIDLHNLLHFLRLRLDHHAQYEIQVYAEKIGEVVKLATPMVWEAFEDYILNSLSFSRQELDYIRSIAGIIKADDDEALAKFNISGLEAKEFRDKLQRLQ
jgi:thymidylate synthase (FAD)